MPTIDKFLAGVSASLVAALLILGWMYRSNVSEFTAYRATVQVEGEKARKEQAEIKAAHEENLTELRSTYEKQIDAIRAGARARYDAELRRVRNENARRGSLRGDAPRVGVDDETERKQFFDRVVANCAEDALKLSAWQALCEELKCETRP